MTAIRVLCRGCRQEVNAAECTDLRCTTCVALDLVADDLASYRRLWAKRARYARARAATISIDQQLRRLALRMSRRLHDRISNPELAAEALNTALERARQAVDTVGGRILVPRIGQEILGAGARA